MATLYFAVVLILLNFIAMSVKGYDEAFAIHLSRISGASYCPAHQLMALKCGFQCEHLVKTNWTPIYSAEHPLLEGTSVSFSILVNSALRKVVIVFRGTYGNLQLLHEILSFTGVPYELQISNTSTTFNESNTGDESDSTVLNESNTSNESNKGPLVQRYFYNTYKKVLRIPLFQQLQVTKATFPNFQFIFTGHSLGGAFSILALTDVVRSGLFPPKTVPTYTFGSPRVGNTAFNRLYHEVVGDSFRLVHHRDMVPHLPLCVVNPLTGDCIKSDSSLLFWFPYHSNNEVFYDNAPMWPGTHKFCMNEDRHCANRYALVATNINDHLYYFGTRISCEP